MIYASKCDFWSEGLYESYAFLCKIMYNHIKRILAKLYKNLSLYEGWRNNGQILTIVNWNRIG